jgi:hypothetical protein
LSAYCVAYQRWRTAEEALARMAEHDATMHGLLVKTIGGDARRRPAAGVGGQPPGGGKFDGLLG